VQIVLIYSTVDQYTVPQSIKYQYGAICRLAKGEECQINCDAHARLEPALRPSMLGYEI